MKDIYKRDGMYKAYIAISTCATTRMLHLELTPDLTTSAYVRSQRRLIARRGCPSLMVSDNGKTFKGKELKQFNAKHSIKWRYNLPRAPWWGGMFERMVRSTKRCLRKTIGLRKLTYEELCTILLEVEAVINNRPLVYIEENDRDQILTPSHLFCGRRTLDHQSEISSDVKTDITKDDVVSRSKKINAAIDHFWKRWQREYLVDLRENHKMRTKTKKIDVKTGDAVLIHEDGVKRNKWSMAVIEELINGKDGVTRGATVKKIGVNGKAALLNRPLQKLYPLEISHDDKATTPSEPSNGQEESISTVNDDAKNVVTNLGDDNTDDSPAPDVGATPEAMTTIDDNVQTTRSKRAAAIDGERRRRRNIELKN